MAVIASNCGNGIFSVQPILVQNYDRKIGFSLTRKNPGASASQNCDTIAQSDSQIHKIMKGTRVIKLALMAK